MTFFAGPRPRVFAHRGWHIGDLHGLENTMVAFRRAVSEGIAYLETDVQVTQDGVPVAFHDDRLERVTDGSGRVADHTWAELTQVRVAGREPIPAMEDVFAALPDARFIVEVKTDSAARALMPLLRAKQVSERICVASFSTPRLQAMRTRLGPTVATSMGRDEVLRFKLRGRLLRLPPAVRAIQVPLRHRQVPVVTRRLVAAAHRSGLEVHVWTIDDPRVMTRLLGLGVDGLITDRPDVAREVLHRW